MSADLKVMDVPYEGPFGRGMVEIWRMEACPAKKHHYCTICGQKMEPGKHFAYRFSYANQKIAKLMVRSCCQAHKEQLEEILARVEDDLSGEKATDVYGIWLTISSVFQRYGITTV